MEAMGIHHCRFCGDAMPPERPYDYCMAVECYELGFEKAAYVVVGQHKGPPLVLAPHDACIVENQNTMRR